MAACIREEVRPGLDGVFGPAGLGGRDSRGRAKVACGDEWLWIDRLLVNGSYVAPDAVLQPGDRLKDSSWKVRIMPAEKDM